MKTLLMTLNSKFIHTSLALRLLYQASKEFAVDFKEYTIKDDLEIIANDIIAMKVDVVAMSCYIWNIEHHIILSKRLKQMKADIIIIYGGPEVSYEAEHFLKNSFVDIIIQGEGEEVFPRLLAYLQDGKEIDLKGISYRKNGKLHIDSTILSVDLTLIEKLDSPYLLERDKLDSKHRILYFESSRGCPYNCQYCLSSLEVGMRFFSYEYIEKELVRIMDSDVKTIKFLDRSFNVRTNHALRILDLIIKHHKEGQQFQFEINADVLDQKIIDFIHQYAPREVIRFEIGIQSTYDVTNKAICRRQDFNRLSEVITQLIDKDIVTLHLDLIAGLPYESYQRFIESFNQVFMFRASELQLGFLKLLRGTTLRKEALKHQYHYQAKPPYVIISNQYLSTDQIEEIHMVEDILEKYWNSGRCRLTLNTIFDQGYLPFQFFLDLAEFFKKIKFSLRKFQLYDLFLHFYEYTKSVNLDVFDELRIDYLRNFKVRPKRWWTPISKEKRNQIIHRIVADDDFLEKNQLNIDILFRYSVIEVMKDDYLIVIYKDMQRDIYQYPRFFFKKV